MGLGAGPRRCLRTDSSAAAGRRRGEERRGEEGARGPAAAAPNRGREEGPGAGREMAGGGGTCPGERRRGLEQQPAAAQGDGEAAGEDRLGARAAVWHRPAPCGTDRAPCGTAGPPLWHRALRPRSSLRAAVKASGRPSDRAGGELVSSSALLLRRFVSPEAPL